MAIRIQSVELPECEPVQAVRPPKLRLANESHVGDIEIVARENAIERELDRYHGWQQCGGGWRKPAHRHN